MQGPTQQCTWLTAVTGAAWGVVAIPAWIIAGAEVLEGMVYAALLCLVPGWLVLCLNAQIPGRTGHVLAAFGGTATRLVFVLAGALMMSVVRPELGVGRFLVWVAVFYFVTLWTETWLVLKSPEEGRVHR